MNYKHIISFIIPIILVIFLSSLIPESTCYDWWNSNSIWKMWACSHHWWVKSYWYLLIFILVWAFFLWLWIFAFLDDNNFQTKVKKNIYNTLNKFRWIFYLVLVIIIFFTVLIFFEKDKNLKTKTYKSNFSYDDLYSTNLKTYSKDNIELANVKASSYYEKTLELNNINLSEVKTGSYHEETLGLNYINSDNIDNIDCWVWGFYSDILETCNCNLWYWLWNDWKCIKIDCWVWGFYSDFSKKCSCNLWYWLWNDWKCIKIN